MVVNGSKKSIFLIVDTDIQRLKDLYNRYNIEYRVEIKTGYNKDASLFAITPYLLLCGNFKIGQNDMLDQISESKRRFPILFLMDDISEMTKIHEKLAGWQVECLPKDISKETLLQKIEFYLNLEREVDQHKRDNVSAKTQLALVQNNFMETLRIITEYRDNDTGGHLKRTSVYVKMIVDELIRRNYNISQEYADQIVRGAPLHDIGKIAISDLILQKPDKFNKSEYDIIKLHVNYGQKIMNTITSEAGADSSFKVAAELVATHHEKWDGTGYPLGIKGSQIPISGRIMAVADVYDALRAERAYKLGIPHSKAMLIIVEDSGKAFDPMIVDVFYSIGERVKNAFGDRDSEIRDELII